MNTNNCRQRDGSKQEPLYHSVLPKGATQIDNTNIDDRLLSRLEVEKRFGIPKRFLELAVSRGEGPPFVRYGRTIRYRVSDLHAWINTKRIDPEL